MKQEKENGTNEKYWDAAHDSWVIVMYFNVFNRNHPNFSYHLIRSNSNHGDS